MAWLKGEDIRVVVMSADDAVRMRWANRFRRPHHALQWLDASRVVA